MINYRIKHIGINHPNAEEASKTAELFRNCSSVPEETETATFLSVKFSNLKTRIPSVHLGMSRFRSTMWKRP